MQQNRRSRVSGRQTIVVLCAGVIAQAAVSAAPPDVLSLAPQDAVAIVGVPDWEAFQQAYSRSAAAKRSEMPGVTPDSVHEFLRFTRQFRERIARLLDLKTEEVRNPLGGPLAVVFAASEDGPRGQIDAVAVLGVRDGDLLRDYVNRATANLARVLPRRQSVNEGRVAIEHFAVEGPREQRDVIAQDEPAAEPDSLFDPRLSELLASDAWPESLAFCIDDERLLVALTPGPIRSILRTRPGQSLAATDAGKKAAAEPANVAVRFFVNVPRLFEQMRLRSERGANETIAMLGGDSIGALFGQMQFGDAAFDSRLDIVALLSGDRSGLAKILSQENQPVALPAECPPETAALASLNVDIPAFADELGRIVGRIDAEQGERMRASLRTLPAGAERTLDLRSDVLAHLRGPLRAFVGFEKPTAPDAARLAITIAHDDRAALAKALDTVMTALPVTPWAESFAAGLDLPVGRLSVALSDRALWLGDRRTLIAALQPSAATAKPSGAAFTRLSEQAAREAWAWLFVDGSRFAADGLDFLRHERQIAAAPLPDPLALAATQFVREFLGIADAGKLGDTRRLADSFGPQLLTISTVPEGIRFTRIELPPQTR